MKWVRGWQKIAEHIGVKDWRTYTKWRNFGLPVVLMPNGQHRALESELDSWLKNYAKRSAQLRAARDKNEMKKAR